MPLRENFLLLQKNLFPHTLNQAAHMQQEELLKAISDISYAKGIDRERLITVVQDAITLAAKRKFRQYQDVEARIHQDSGNLEVYHYKTVVENVEDQDNQLSLQEAKSLDTSAQLGDVVEYEIDNEELRKVIAQTARQMVFQKVREAEREFIYEKFKDRVGEVLNGVISRSERGRTYVNFNQTEAILYPREQIPTERYSSGDHIRVILLEVRNDPKEPAQLVVSRAHPDLLVKLFEMEVPEVYDGIVEIVGATREPGRRSKVSVRSNDSDVDPVGACVGMRGSRVQSIVNELRGEKIDIVQYSEDELTYLANALAPAELTRVKINEEEEEIDVQVEPDQLSLAIGRQGQNVRLASKLLNKKINISSTVDQTLSLEAQIRERLLASQAELDKQVEDKDSSPEDSIIEDKPQSLSAEEKPSQNQKLAPQQEAAVDNIESAEPPAETTADSATAEKNPA